jgi:hypothetical protein
MVAAPTVSGLLAFTTYKRARVFPGSMNVCHRGAMLPPTSRITTSSVVV